MTGILLLAASLSGSFGAGMAVPPDTTGPVARALAFVGVGMRAEFPGAAAELRTPDSMPADVREALARQIPAPLRDRGEVVQCESWSDVEPPAIPKCTFIGISRYLTVTVHELDEEAAIISVGMASPANNRQRIVQSFVKLKLIRDESGWRVESVLSRAIT